jgi:hypothetical protein
MASKRSCATVAARADASPICTTARSSVARAVSSAAGVEQIGDGPMVLTRAAFPDPARHQP